MAGPSARKRIGDRRGIDWPKVRRASSHEANDAAALLARPDRAARRGAGPSSGDAWHKNMVLLRRGGGGENASIANRRCRNRRLLRFSFGDNRRREAVFHADNGVNRRAARASSRNIPLSVSRRRHRRHRW